MRTYTLYSGEGHPLFPGEHHILVERPIGIPDIRYAEGFQETIASFGLIATQAPKPIDRSPNRIILEPPLARTKIVKFGLTIIKLARTRPMPGYEHQPWMDPVSFSDQTGGDNEEVDMWELDPELYTRDLVRMNSPAEVARRKWEDEMDQRYADFPDDWDMYP